MNNDPKPCPNCDNTEVYLADHCNYVICQQCHMTGPDGHSEEEAVKLWNSLPRRGEAVVTAHEICDRCGGELVPGLVHYCMSVIEEQMEERGSAKMYQGIVKGSGIIMKTVNEHISVTLPNDKRNPDGLMIEVSGGGVSPTINEHIIVTLPNDKWNPDGLKWIEGIIDEALKPCGMSRIATLEGDTHTTLHYYQVAELLPIVE